MTPDVGGSLGAAARRLDARLGGLARWGAPAAVAVPLCIVAAIATGVHSGFPTNWVLGVPRWFDSLDSWVTDHQSSNFFLHHIVGGFGSALNDTTNWVVELLHWMTWLGRAAGGDADRVAGGLVAHGAVRGADGVVVRHPPDPERWPRGHVADVAQRDDDAGPDGRGDHPLDPRRDPGGHRVGCLANGPQDLEPGARPDADPARVRLPGADRRAVLDRQPGRDHRDLHLRGASPRALHRDRHPLGPEGRDRSRGGVRRDAPAGAAERAAAARGPGDHARAEPGDHDGAVDRRDRLAGRRRRARRSGAERPADPTDRRRLHRRRPDRVHGDVARPHVGGLRPAHGSFEGRVDAHPAEPQPAARHLGRDARGHPRLALRVQPGRLAVELGLLGRRRRNPRAQLDHERVHRHQRPDLELPDARHPEPAAALAQRSAVVARRGGRRHGRLGAGRCAARRSSSPGASCCSA